MYCSSCGTKNVENARFCVKCGVGLAAGEAQGSPIAHPHSTTEQPCQSPGRYPFLLKWWTLGLVASIAMASLVASIGYIGGLVSDAWLSHLYLTQLIAEQAVSGEPIVSYAKNEVHRLDRLNYVCGYQAIIYAFLSLLAALGTGLDARQVSRKGRRRVLVALRAWLWAIAVLLLPMIMIPVYLRARESFCGSSDPS